MISVSGRKWKEAKVNSNLVEKIEQDFSFSKILSQLIISRKFDDKEIFLINNELELKNFFQENSDFLNSAKIVENAIKNKEKICIFGDYDVDGSVATSLFVNLFKKLNCPYFYYIPDRIKDGYGANVKLFEKIILKDTKLVIMVDCGSTSNEAIDFLNQKNINSIIIDHHEINKPFPKANVIINPKKNNGYQEYDYLCASTLSYFFLEILIKRAKYKINLQKYLIYILLATICDVMPLRKMNKLISKVVLKDFKINENHVFSKLYKLNNRKNKLNINDLSFLIGPILNSGGRLGKSYLATELLISDDEKIINKKSLELTNLNNKRKNIETEIMNDIDFNNLNKANDKIIIYYNSNISEGLIGIIAAKLKDYYNLPSVVITNSNNILKGSARSINGYNIGSAIKKSLDKNIILKGGGHNMAAGFSLKRNKIDIFKNFLLNDFLKSTSIVNNLFTYDAYISTTAINRNFYNDISKIGPFGNENPIPIFYLKELKVIKSSILNKKHISCILKSKAGKSISSIAFDSLNTPIGNYLLNYKKSFHVLGQINENFWNNKRTLQLIIKDIIL